MFNSIISNIRNTVFGYQAEPVLPISDEDNEAAMDAYIREMREQYEADQAEMRAEWASLTDREREEHMDWMDELSIRGIADTHRFYSYWKASRCN